ncbi:hypothetical protein LINGRAHAP2_LOCUS30485, partial [Linum grandiflorum]
TGIVDLSLWDYGNRWIVHFESFEGYEVIVDCN